MAPLIAMDAARLAAVMVRVHGPDPKGRKMRQHAFFHAESGDTTLSASGFLVPCNIDIEKAGNLSSDSGRHNETATSSESSVVVITCASIVEPFLAPRSQEEFPKLIRGTEVDVLVEVPDGEDFCSSGEHSVCWLPAQLLTVVDVPAARAALQDLLDVHGGSAKGVWEVGWALAPVEDNAQQLHSLLTAEVLTDTQIQMQARYLMAEPRKRGDSLIAVGSPFGALSPLHFQNSMSVGIVSNLWPPTRHPASLLMADLRCLPGMEGGPVFDEHGVLVGMLTRPLRQRGGAAEVQLVMTTTVLMPVLQRIGINVWAPLVGWSQYPSCHSPEVTLQSADSTLLQAQSCHTDNFQSHQSFQTMRYIPSAVEQAVTSVVLITIGDGAWASGIILNKTGLILTNAHLLEPWRFGKSRNSRSPVSHAELVEARILNHEDTQNARSYCYGSHLDNSRLKTDCGDNSAQRMSVSSCGAQPQFVKNSTALPTGVVGQHNYQHIRVRLDHHQQHSWHAAHPIYVSRGPLDIALLQLELPPQGLCPIVPEKECPTPGSTAVVLGHGLFGPRSELCPSVSAGVVARVVKACSTSFFSIVHTSDKKEDKSGNAAMLQTTAAVHPGGSGGAVVNGEGRMIGLVTSNARHSGGTVIPYLNFSVPCAALIPVFDFASGGKYWSLLMEVDKPNEQLAAVWALVPPTPPRPSPLRILPMPKSMTQDKDGEKGQPKGSQFAEFISKRGSELAWKLPESVEHESSGHGSSQPNRLEPSYATRPSFPVHSRL
ncbi:unnamed protein product [Sphagnum troendelagicum]|uniref:Glyoxysomal processing protease, glyoxysomal n=1 Tax=Sphagnum troendelagicum TaxID=128251 RepID=A0ABP0V4F9_9BRYO